MGAIHVLHVLNSAHGGSALSTLELIAALAERGVKSSLVCFDNASDEQKSRIQEQVNGRALFIPLYWMNKKIRTAFWKRPILEWLSLVKTWKGYRYQKEIGLLIKQHGVTLVHTSTILNPEGAIAARRNNLPHVWHVRELIGPDQHFHFYNYPSWADFVQRHCEYLIANSSVTELCLWKYFPKEKVLCIPNGIDIDAFAIKQHSNSRKLVIGMIGSITTRWKNHEFFIRTAALFSNHSNVEFRIYGTLPSAADPYFGFLKNLVSGLGAGETIKFTPFAQPSAIIGEIDIMFHPSKFESFGRIIVEAMAGGIPVVAVNEGGPLEMVKDGINGFLIENDNHGEAHDKLSILMNDPAMRNKFGMNGRQLVESNYTLDRLATEMIGVYKLMDRG